MLVHNEPNLLITVLHGGWGAVEIESHYADRFSGGGVCLFAVAEAMLCAFFAGTTPDP